MPERRFILTTPQINTLFHAKIDGIPKYSNVESATITGSPTTNQKRIHIAAVTIDSFATLIITPANIVP